MAAIPLHKASPGNKHSALPMPALQLHSGTTLYSSTAQSCTQTLQTSLYHYKQPLYEFENGLGKCR